MRLSRTDLGPVLTIMIGVAIGLFSFGALALASSDGDRVVTSPQLLDDNGALRQGVTGTWVLAVDLGSEGSGNAKFVLEQKGTAVTGTYTGAMGRRVEVSGTAEDGRVELFFGSNRGVIAYEGTLEGTMLKGTCVYGELGEGTFAGRIRG